MTENTLDATDRAPGAGDLLERDYWAVLHQCQLAPHEVTELVASRFAEFAPPELVSFRRCDDTDAPLDVGDELEVGIRMAGKCGVRVVHRDRNSFTLATLPGHPEAGRITFGAYRNDRGDVVFHIRSRARSSSSQKLLGFITLGEPMQTNTWSDFINSVAATVARGVVGFIRADTHRVEDEPADIAGDGPTFIARGD